MLKAITAAILVIGIALIIIAAVRGSIAFAVVGDVLVVAGVVLYWYFKKTAQRASGSSG